MSHVGEGILHVLRRPFRSALTAVTVAVAIAVVVNVVSLAYGMDEDIRRDMRRFGHLTVDVGRSPLLLPRAEPVRFGPEEEALIRRTVQGLGATVVPIRQRVVTAVGDAEVTRVAVAAVPPAYPRTLALDLVAGRWFSDDERGASVCVLDASLEKALFPDVERGRSVGRRIRFTGAAAAEPLVVGVLEDPMTYRALFEAFDENRKSRALSNALLAFRNAYVPADAIPGPSLSSVSVALPDEARLEQATARLARIWPRIDVAHAAESTAPIVTFERRGWMASLDDVSRMGAVVGNIVWILVVGVACVMISVLNLINIRERYDEIAVRRCEGATKADLAMQVAGENVAIAVVGGALGLPLGWLGASLLREMVDVPFRFETKWAFPAMGIALALGLLASLVPARRAAALDPARILSRRLT